MRPTSHTLDQPQPASIQQVIFEQTVDELKVSEEAALAKATTLRDRLLSGILDPIAVMETYDTMVQTISMTKTRFFILFSNHPSKDIRTQGYEMYSRLGAWLKKAEDSPELRTLLLQATDQQNDFSEAHKVLADVIRTRLVLSDGADNPQIREAARSVEVAKAEFFQALEKSPVTLQLSPAEATGIPAQLLSQWRTENGDYAIKSSDPGQTRQVLAKASLPETRQKIFMAMNGPKRAELVDPLRKIFRTRAELAKMRGFSDWNSYRMREKRLFSNPDKVLDLLNGISNVTNELWSQRLVDAEKLTGRPLQVWDFEHISSEFSARMSQEAAHRRAKFIRAEIAPAVAVGHVAAIFGLAAVEETLPRAWASDVKAFGIYGSAGRIGLLIVDTFARPGKSIWAQTSLLSIDPMHNRVAAVFDTALVEDGQMSLRDFQTLFHELGHAFDALLGKSPHFLTSRDPITLDYTEIPSTYAEVMLTQRHTLENLRDPVTGQTIVSPAVAAELAEFERMSLVQTLRGLVGKASMDLMLHSEKAGSFQGNDYCRLANSVYSAAVVPVPEDACLPLTFNHIYSFDYDSLYYSYASSFAIAADLLAEVRKDAEGKVRLVEELFRPQYLRPAADSLRAFLGREPSAEALRTLL